MGGLGRNSTFQGWGTGVLTEAPLLSGKIGGVGGISALSGLCFALLRQRLSVAGPPGIAKAPAQSPGLIDKAHRLMSTVC